MRSKEQIAVLHDLFHQINERLAIIGETPDAYFLCQCVDILKHQGATIDAQATRITEIEAQLADAKQANQWQLIETAPKDGTVILVSRNIESGYEKRVIGTDYFKDGSWWLSRAEMQPTHWMPLHNPPIAVTKE